VFNNLLAVIEHEGHQTSGPQSSAR
jgi:hypothetical protein